MLRDLHFPLGLVLGAIATTLAFSIGLGWIGTQAPPAPTPAPTPVPTAIPPFFTRTPAEKAMIEELISFFGWKHANINLGWAYGSRFEDSLDPSVGLYYIVVADSDDPNGKNYVVRFEHNLRTEFVLKDHGADGIVDEIWVFPGLLDPQTELERTWDMAVIFFSKDSSRLRPLDDRVLLNAFREADRLVRELQLREGK